MTTSLSIIVPCLNEAAGIASALERLQPLRKQGVEVIVADGGSEDGTATLAAPWADRVIAAPRGRAAQMNAGAAEARAEVLLFLHADCTLPADADKLIIDGLAANGKRWGRFDVVLNGIHPMLRVVAALMNLRSRWTGIATGDQGIFIARSLFAELDGFPPLPLMEDIALSRLARRAAPPLCLRDQIITSARRWEREGVMRTVLLMWRLRLAYFFGADPATLAARYDPVRARD
jgi:rSAM/selenodomain-associated transferase 2